jgi:plasmid stabilization system protein ParE
MGAELLFTPETHQDLDDAFAWYERRRPGLGEEFLLEIAGFIQGICEQPELRPVEVDDYRRAMATRFPYSIIYSYDGRFVTIYAVIHNSRDASAWRRRLSGS